PLSELYTADARHAIEDAGGSVVTGAAVASLALEAERAQAVLLRDGRRVDADAVILAVPCAALLRLLPPALRAAPPFRALAAVGTSPIVSVHLWLDRPVGWGSSFLGLLGGRAQWLFDCGPARDGGQRGGRLSLRGSDGAGLPGWSSESPTQARAAAAAR